MRTRRIERLWERMSAMYGSRWEIEYGPALQRDGALAVVAELWAEALDPLPNDRLAAGIKACIDRDNLNPPSMPEVCSIFQLRISARTTTTDGAGLRRRPATTV